MGLGIPATGGPPVAKSAVLRVYAARGSPAFCSSLFKWTTVGPWFIISLITLTEMSLHTIMGQKQCEIAIANVLNIQIHLQYIYQIVLSNVTFK